MTKGVDVCLIVEGGYPYVVGGVASWADALMRASPHLTFHVIAINTSRQPRHRKFALPPNLADVTDVLLDVCPRGRVPTSRNVDQVERIVALAECALTAGDGAAFVELVERIVSTGFGQAALLDSKEAWLAMERAYERLLPGGSLLDFFWSWRFFMCGLLTLINTPLPKAGVFHAVATGFSGVLGSYAKVVAKRPLLVTEHGIYTNERRIELAVADWLFDSGAAGFDLKAAAAEMRSIWLNAFRSFSRITYAIGDVVTSQHRVNRELQRADGALDDKLRILPNGIDVAKFGGLPRETKPRAPTVLMVGRIVPIKDIRTFVMAIALLRNLVPGVVALLIGPEDEDPEYAEGCRRLAHQLGAEASIKFLGRVPDVVPYLLSADLLVLSSICESQPIAMLEAAATGLPVVATDVGSCREIIEGFDADPTEGRGGIVVEPCNPKAMAEALAEILGDERMRSIMGDVMRRRVSSYYHKDRVTRLYEQLYADLTAKPVSYIDYGRHVEHPHHD